ncbi:MAG: AEC family transporter [Peptococcaceae bacterium]
MSQQFYVVVNQVLVFAILMLIGFGMAKAKVLTADVLNGLSKLIVKLLLPCLIVYQILGNGITVQHLMANGRFAAALLLLYAVLGLLGFTMAASSGLRRSGKDMFAVATMFCNIGFMGIPLLQSMFPGNGLVSAYLLIYMMLDQLLLWSVGLFFCTWHAKRKQAGSALRNLLNPMTVGIVLALTVLYLDIPVPAPLLDSIQGLGDCSRYLALLYLGALLATMPVLSILTKPYVYFLIVLKMTVLPVLVYFVAGFFFDSTIQMVLAVIVSLPPMVANTMMARTYGGDERVAAETVFVGTIACLGSIPLVQFMIAVLF